MSSIQLRDDSFVMWLVTKSASHQSSLVHIVGVNRRAPPCPPALCPPSVRQKTGCRSTHAQSTAPDVRANRSHVHAPQRRGPSSGRAKWRADVRRCLKAKRAADLLQCINYDAAATDQCRDVDQCLFQASFLWGGSPSKNLQFPLGKPVPKR